MKKIMLDAGHFSNYNKSPIYEKYSEGNMTWKLQKYLKEELEKYNFEVDTTRKNRDSDLALYSRGYKAKGYDLFLSLHSNAADASSVDRIVIIKGFDNKDDTLAKKLASTIEEVMQVKQASQIFTKTWKNDEYFGVLRGARAAGVKDRYILEHSFHTNYYAAMWLSKDENLKELARAEAITIAKYFGNYKDADFKNGSYNKVARVKCNKSLNVRGNRPSLDGELAPVIDSIQNGKLVTLGYVFNNWGSVYYDNKHGFVNCDYLELIE